jgi:hypothetical protein
MTNKYMCNLAVRFKNISELQEYCKSKDYNKCLFYLNLTSKNKKNSNKFYPEK